MNPIRNDLSLSLAWKILFITLVLISIPGFFISILGEIVSDVPVPYVKITLLQLCDIVFWILLLVRWYGGWRKYVLILLAVPGVSVSLVMFGIEIPLVRYILF